MNAAAWDAVITAAAALLSAAAALIHSIKTRGQLAAHANSMEHAATGTARPGPVAGDTSRYKE